MSGSCRYTLSTALLAVALAAVMVPTLAFATGADWQNPEVLPPPPWSGSIDGTLTTVNYLGGFTDYEYWYSFNMSAGQTISVTATVAVGSDTDFMFTTRAFVHDSHLVSDPFDSTHRVLAIMAPRTSTYLLEVYSSTPGTFTIKSVAIPPVRYSLSAFSVPKAAKRKKNFTVSVKVSPDYDSIFVPIRYYIERKSGKRWKKYGTAKGSILSGSAAYTKFSAKLKLPKATFRVRARFVDAAHAKAKYTAWKTVKVK
jgi:hypothetical protein